MKLLQTDFAEASKLPEQSQYRIAADLLHELTSDVKRDASLAAFAPQLEQLATEALEEYWAGRTGEL